MSEVTRHSSKRKSNRAAAAAGGGGGGAEVTAVASSPPVPKDKRSSSRDTGTASPAETRNADANGTNGRDKDGDTPSKKTKKRRKVNHACLYCRRSHMTCDQARPCSRCIKRNIPHLCHDEPRESKKGKSSDANNAQADDITSPEQTAPETTMGEANKGRPSKAVNMDSNSMMVPPVIAGSLEMSDAQTAREQEPQTFNENIFNGLGSSQNQPQDVQRFHPNYVFNTSEVTNEYNLLGDFLNNSLMDDGTFYPGDDAQLQFADPSMSNVMGTAFDPNFMFSPSMFIDPQPSMPPAPEPSADNKSTTKKPSSNVDKAQERYYMTAADPAGTAPADERMIKILKEKYDAGLLKPFNYVRGYSRLNKYMEDNLKPVARQRILQQLDIFRPKFREKMQNLKDIELVVAEMWFERKLMDIDRVFASMAIPACCWRRTGEVFRGNREMSELIGVPLENLRDGKLAIHEFICEESLVSYWSKFGGIAFDERQKGVVTSCKIKRPKSEASTQGVFCCFSFTIQRDPFLIPSLIMGNFLPVHGG